MIESCRGQTAKQALCKEYKIELVTRLMRYNGQTIKGCCGDITTEYFIFRASHRVDSQCVETIVVGGHCGRAFLKLIGESVPKLFNALPSLPSKRPGQPTTAATNEHELLSARLTPLNLQMYNAIHLLVSAWGGECKGKLADFLIYLRQHPERDTDDWVINALNRIVAKDVRRRSLTAMAAQLRVDNPGLHFYEFNLLESRLKDQTSHF